MLHGLALAAPLLIQGILPSAARPRPELAWIDIDGDGRRDLYVIDPTQCDLVLSNRGDGRFEDVTAAWGLAGLDATRVAAWQDVDHDGRLDLFVVSATHASRLLLQRADGFVDVTAEYGLAHQAADIGARWVDFDDDGWMDLEVSGARGERLYRNLAGKRFERIALPLATHANTTSIGAGTERTDEAESAGAGAGNASSNLAGGLGSSNRAGANSQSPASVMPRCVDGINDQSQHSICLLASSVPTLGELMPLSSDFFVDPSGQVGMGTLTPTARLDVAGLVRATAFAGDGANLGNLSATNLATGTVLDARLSSNVAQLLGAQTFAGTKSFSSTPNFTNAAMPFNVTSANKVSNLNADLLDGLDSTAFLRSIPVPLNTNGSAAGALVTDNNSSAAAGAMALLCEASANGTARNYGLVARTHSTQGIAVYGESLATAAGNSYAGFFECDGANGFGVFGRNTSTTSGYGGWFEIANPASIALVGIAASPSNAATNTSVGVYGSTESNGTNSYAAIFDGKVHVNGNLSKSGGSFKIDHPVDPANKTLSHSFVESPDMMNVYNGNVVTDGNGAATIELPVWFEALNRDFRYQLTVVDENDFARVRVAHGVEHNRFSIRTDRGNVEVSWQVTGIRKDPWAEQNRIPVEEEKEGQMRGRYLNPEAYGMPKSMGATFTAKPESNARTTPR